MFCNICSEHFLSLPLRLIPHKYGTNGKIRAKELGGKAYFANPDYAVQRLLALFGVDKARVALRG